jgi:hypothetical protein
MVMEVLQLLLIMFTFLCTGRSEREGIFSSMPHSLFWDYEEQPGATLPAPKVSVFEHGLTIHSNFVECDDADVWSILNAVVFSLGRKPLAKHERHVLLFSFS